MVTSDLYMSDGTSNFSGDFSVLFPSLSDFFFYCFLITFHAKTTIPPSFVTTQVPENIMKIFLQPQLPLPEKKFPPSDF